MGLNKNDIVNIEITGMNHQGQGVGHVDGLTVFVEGAIVGEVISTKIEVLKKSYATGVIVEILKSSPERALPFCPAYNRCGGCDIQHLTYRQTLKFKKSVVKDNLRKIGKIQDVIIHDTIGMEQPFNYRNKTQFPYGSKGGQAVSGLYAKKSHEIIGFMECAIQGEAADKIKRIVDEFIAEYKVNAYDEEMGTGHIRHLIVRTAHKSQEVMVIFVVNGRGFPGMDLLIQTLVAAVPQVSSIYVNVNRQRTNVILGKENILLHGKRNIIDYMGGFRFSISPMSFYQVNTLQTEVLYRKALEYAALTGNETVFDLYCGVGTISIFLSKNAKKVIGVEVVKEAVDDANKNIELNEIGNVEFVAGEAEKVIPAMYKNGVRADVVVVDPPRKGCDTELLKTMVSMQPQRIVYISCNPATLARDLGYLVQNGYDAVEVQPVDMFGWTKHVETVCLIQRVESE